MIQLCVTATSVSYLNMCYITWLIILPADGDAISKTCRRDINCTVVFVFCGYIGFVNKTHILIAWHERCVKIQAILN
jgi:hypothetical protein